MENGAAQRVQCGRVKAKLGRETKMRPLAALVKAMCATMRCTSSGCMGLARSLFSCRIGSWQRVALSCHMDLDMLVPGNEWALVAGPPLQQEKPFFHRGRAVTKTERVVVRK